MILFGVTSICMASKACAGKNSQDFRSDEIICRMQPGYQIDVINETYGTSVKNHQVQTDCYLLATEPGQDIEYLVGQVGSREDVLYCGPNYYLDAPEAFQKSQPFLDELGEGDVATQDAAVLMEFPTVHALSTGAGVKVAIIDCGINFYHSEFTKSGVETSGWDYIDSDGLAYDEPGGSGSGHGTFVAGIVRMVAPEAEIIAYRALDTTGRGNGYDIASAILQAIEDGCRVINLSLGMIGRHDAMDDALRLAEQYDVVVTAAAGNDSSSICAIFPYPAEKTYCIAVAALDTLNVKADFSNYGIKVAVCAPGVGIYAPYLGEQYAWWSGTSFSTPFVTGLAALIFSVNPELTWQDVFDLIEGSAVDIDSLNEPYANLLGAGLIDMAAAVTLAGNVTIGDADGSGSINIGDAVFLLNYIFRSGPEPVPLSAGDASCSGSVNIGDVVYLIHHIFHSGPAPCETGPEQGRN